MENNSYPINLKIDYSDHSDRLKTFFRIILVLQLVDLRVVLSNSDAYDHESTEKIRFFTAAGIVFIPTLLMILFRQKYPRWWFDWNLALTKFSM